MSFSVHGIWRPYARRIFYKSFSIHFEKEIQSIFVFKVSSYKRSGNSLANVNVQTRTGINSSLTLRFFTSTATVNSATLSGVVDPQLQWQQTAKMICMLSVQATCHRLTSRIGIWPHTLSPSAANRMGGAAAAANNIVGWFILTQHHH